MNKPRPKRQSKEELKEQEEMEYLSKKLDSFNSKQLIQFIDNWCKVEDTTLSEAEQDKAYDNIMNLFYGRKRGK